MRPPLNHRKPIQSDDLRQDNADWTALGQRAASNDRGLTAVIEAWDRLPDAVRAGIVAMVKAASNGGGK